MAHAYKDFKGAYNSLRSISAGLNTETFVRLWVLSILTRSGESLWAAAIKEQILNQTRVVEDGKTVFEGYVPPQGTLLGVIHDLADKGFIEIDKEGGPTGGPGVRQAVAYRITDTGRAELDRLKQEKAGAIEGALRILQMFTNQVYDAQILTTRLRTRYTDKAGDPTRVLMEHEQANSKREG